MFKYLLIFFLLIFTSASSEIIKKIEILGNKRISLETIKVYGDISENDNFTKFDSDKVLKSLYSTDFFEDIKLDFNNGILKITVKEYRVINAIYIKGEETKKITKGILERLKLKEKGSFIKNTINEDIELIKNIYASIGHNFTTVDAKIESFSDDRVNLIYSVDKGEKTSISKIYFIGNKKIKDKRLRDLIVSEEDKFWKFLSSNTSLNYNNIELDKRLLKNYYKSAGYYDVQVVSSNAEINKNNETILTYNINAGTRYKVNKITTNVSDVFDKKIFVSLNESYQKIIGKYYSPFKIKKLLAELDNLIADADLQFVEHNVKEVLEGDNITIQINVYEGNKQLVEKINIKGNSVTNEAVIRAELLLDEGDPFNSLNLEKSIARLKSRNIFGAVTKEIKNGSNKDQKIIDISVEEKPTGEISAGAGIGTNGGSFAFNVSENNWLGKGMRVSTNLEVDANSLKGELNVLHPNYNYSDNDLNYYISSASNDKDTSGFKNTTLSSGIGTTFEQYKNVYLSPNLSVTHDDLKVSNEASASLKKQEGTFTDLSFDYGIQLDVRDRSFMPTEGYITSFNQTIPFYADTPFLRNAFSYRAYNSFTPNVIGAFKFYTAAINGLNDEDVRVSKRIFLPGSLLRGFKAGRLGPRDLGDYVGGNYAVAVNFEAALPNLLPESTGTDVGLFLDLGNLWGVDYDSSVGNSNILRSSTGINTSWSSPVGPMTFVFAKSLRSARTDTTEGFNFRLGTTF